MVTSKSFQRMELPGEEGVGSTMVAVAVGWGMDVDGIGVLATLLARNQTVARRIHPNTKTAIIFFMEALVPILILPPVSRMCYMCHLTFHMDLQAEIQNKVK
jgi:hypothetical protein